MAKQTRSTSKSGGSKQPAPAANLTTRESIPPQTRDQVEAETQRIGAELWEHLSRRRPTIFESRWWLDHILEWAMEDESVKVQMFRFVDVLPMLKTHEQVIEHLQEYFDDVKSKLPWAGRLVLKSSPAGSLTGKALALTARRNARKMAERFIAGTRVEEVLQSVARLRKQGLAFTLDLLGEAVVSEPEADAYQKAYLDLIAGLAPEVAAWTEVPQLDHDGHGVVPRCNVSIKLSALYSQFKPIDPVGSTAGVLGRLRPILRLARQQGAYVHVDMEHYAYKDLTLDIFKQVLMEEEFRDWPDCGIVIQAYLPDAGQDLDDLLSWVKERGTPIVIRLVKGAYWDYETVISEYRGWPCPVYTEKWQSDANFERQTAFLMQHRKWLKPAIASHNLRSLAHAIAWAKVLGVPDCDWEIQMLYGMAVEQQELFSELGHRVRVYTPFGEPIPGMAYLVRRLLENTSNDSFLRHAYDADVEIEDLLRKPSRFDEATAV
ncbi:MAG: proline dehydrogenase family protein [Planctomycetaceae bacterium]